MTDAALFVSVPALAFLEDHTVPHVTQPNGGVGGIGPVNQWAASNRTHLIANAGDHIGFSASSSAPIANCLQSATGYEVALP